MSAPKNRCCQCDVFTNTFLLLGVLALPLPCWSSAGGKTAFAVLEVAEDARPAGMSGAYTAVADDVSALHWNPAGLGKINRQQASASYLNYIVDINTGSLAYAVPAWGGGLGIGITYLNYGQMTDDTAEILLENGRTYYWPYDLVAQLAYGRRISHGLWVGMTAKGIYENIRGYSAQGVAADVGALVEADRLLPLNLGVTVKNLGIMTKAFVEEKAALPLSVHLGLGGKWFSEALTLAAEAVYQPVYGDLSYHMGGEYCWQHFLSLRAGYQTALQDLKSGGSDAFNGFSFGLGVHSGDYSLDYAFVPYSLLGGVHRISLSLQWGETRILPEPPAVSKPQPAVIPVIRPKQPGRKTLRPAPAPASPRPPQQIQTETGRSQQIGPEKSASEKKSGNKQPGKKGRQKKSQHRKNRAKSSSR